MAEKSQDLQLFRKEALDRLTSPDRLDHLMQVVSPIHWLPLAALAFLMSAALLWSLAGRVPVNVEGRGAMIYPHHAAGVAPVEDFASLAAGKVAEVRVRRGDWVRAGSVLVVVDMADLARQLELQQQKLSGLQAQLDLAASLLGEKASLASRASDTRRRNLQERIAALQALGAEIHQRQLRALHVQQAGLRQRLADTGDLAKTLEGALDTRRRLKEGGLISDTFLLETQRAYLDATAQASDLEARLRDLDAREVELRRAYLETVAQITEIESQLADLDVARKTLAIERSQILETRRNEVDEVQRTIAQLRGQIRNQGEVSAPASGRILEINALVGQAVSPGMRLGAIEVQAAASTATRGARHVAVGYFAIAEGKRIRAGMPAQVTPDSVKREEFGGIRGEVTHVSEFPVSPQAAGVVVNNAALAQSLTEGGRVIEVFIELEPDTVNASGYRWTSSKGPSKRILGTTTAGVRITVEQRTPLSFVLPILRVPVGEV